MMVSPSSNNKRSGESSTVRRCGLIASRSSAPSEAKSPFLVGTGESMDILRWLASGFSRDAAASNCSCLHCTQSTNIDVNRDGICLVVIERFQEGQSHLVQYETANERPQDSKRVDSRAARKPDAGENAENVASQLFAFMTPFRRIDDRVSECSGRQARALVCVGPHGESHGAKGVFARFPFSSGFEPPVQFPVTLDRQEAAHLGDGIDFLRQHCPDLAREIRGDTLIPTGWVVEKFLHGQFQI